MSLLLNIVCGMPASGKSVFASLLAKRDSAALIELDSLSEPIVQASLLALNRSPDDRDSEFYKLCFREPIYNAMYSVARDNLNAGVSVVLVGPFTRELQQRDWTSDDGGLRRAIAVNTDVEYTVRVFYVHCDDALRRARMLERANPRDTAKLTGDWQAHAERYQRPAFDSYVAVDSTTQFNMSVY